LGDVNQFSEILSQGWPELPEVTRSQMLLFYKLILEENQSQNLTRILSAQDFYDSNVQDTRELVESGYLGDSVLEVGSGAGLPGILCALIQPMHLWTFSDSEKSKAAFIERALGSLSLKHGGVWAGRAEDLLRKREFCSVCARAVGKVDKIFEWIRECSTWNNLILFKGPAWEDEWKEFQSGRNKNRLTINAVREYSVGVDKKRRVLVNLERKK